MLLQTEQNRISMCENKASGKEKNNNKKNKQQQPDTSGDIELDAF